MIHNDAYHAILEAKYARIISAINELHGVSFEEAMDIFYNSLYCLLLRKVWPICIVVVTAIWPMKFGGNIKIFLEKPLYLIGMPQRLYK